MNILVIGDNCLDRHIYGECKRLCPEAPVPVFTPIRTVENYGMAGNVSRNLKALGNKVEELIPLNVPVKTRYIDDHTNQMFLRVDEDDYCSWVEFRLDEIDPKKYDAIVIADYDKGFLTKQDILFISRLHDITFLDTKKILGSWAERLSYIKLNSQEYKQNLDILKQNETLMDKVIVTKGPEGCVFKNEIYPVKKVDVKDLSGAGDTFMAGLVSQYIQNGNHIEDAIKFANECATIVVQKRGVACL